MIKFEQLLAERKMTEQDYRQELAKQLAMRKFYESQVNMGEIPSEEDIFKFYIDHLSDRYTVPELIKVRRIETLVKPDQTKEQAYAKMLEIATAVHDAVRDVTDPGRRQMIFDDFARKYSDGPNARNGGYVFVYGWIALDRDFLRACHETEVNEISPITEMKDGYCLVIVESKTPGRIRSFEEVKGEIQRSITMDRFTAKRKRFMDWIRYSYPVTIYRLHLYRGIE